MSHHVVDGGPLFEARHLKVPSEVDDETFQLQACLPLALAQFLLLLLGVRLLRLLG